MGWCSATEIMDAAVGAAEAAVKAVMEGVANAPRESWQQSAVDEALRPFVSVIAAKLRDGDWDCIEESEYFERFPQEMLGYDDQRYLQHLLEKIKDDIEYDDGANIPALTDKLVAHRRKMGQA